MRKRREPREKETGERENQDSYIEYCKGSIGGKPNFPPSSSNSLWGAYHHQEPSQTPALLFT